MTKLYARSGRSRGEFFSRVGALREVDPLVNLAYKLLNEKDFAASDQGAAAEDKWHVSFHGSEFPGDNPYACGRHALYRLLDIPQQSPFNRRGRQMMDMGKDFETRLVWAWYHAGFLVSAPPDGAQTMFEDSEHWLTSTVDSILVKPRSNIPFVGEVKQVGAQLLDDLRNLAKPPNEKHVRQLKCQIGLAHEVGALTVKRCHNTGALALQDSTCPIHGLAKCLTEQLLEPVSRGYLYYISRDDPDDTFEFLFDYDANFMRAGRRKLAEWKAAFEADQLPQSEWGSQRYSHPFGWKWSLDQYPCKWCTYGDICRDDHDLAKERGGPIALYESNALEVAERFRPDWSYDAVKAAVYERWGLAAQNGSRVAARAIRADKTRPKLVQ